MASEGAQACGEGTEPHGESLVRGQEEMQDWNSWEDHGGSGGD